MSGTQVEGLIAVFMFFVGVFVGWQFCLANVRRQNTTPARRVLKREQQLKNFVGQVTNLVGKMSPYVGIELTEASPSRIYRFQVVGLLSNKVFCTFVVPVDPDADVQVNFLLDRELSGKYSRKDILSHVLPFLRQAIAQEYPSAH